MISFFAISNKNLVYKIYFTTFLGKKKMVEVRVLVRVSASRFPVQAIKNKIRVNSYLLFYLVRVERKGFSRPHSKEEQKARASSRFYSSLVRVERIELSSQVWKTCILTTVLYPLVNGVGYRDRTDDLLDHNQTL